MATIPSATADLDAEAVPDCILIIEDEAAIADTLLYALKNEGFDTHWASLARDGLAYLQEQPVDLVILDVGLPDENGFELCKRIRGISEIPVMFLTARREEVDRIVGLEIGADDYITKPFSPREVAARVKTILRRTRALPPGAASREGEGSSEIVDFYVDDTRKRISFTGQTLALTRYEYFLLRTLLAQPERIFSRAQLMDQIWDEPEASFERAVDTHIKSLRAKLREVAPERNPIQTHRGLGYSLQPGS
jgi:two-component system, OmpR family, catabolic regulation response regulator CreB